MAAVEEEAGGAVQAFKDLFAGAAGGVAQVLLGPFLLSTSSRSLRRYVLSHVPCDSCCIATSFTFVV
jgi:hypothetical protein